MSFSDIAARLRTVLDEEGVVERRQSYQGPLELIGNGPLPADLRQFYAETDGLMLSDGTTIVPLEAIAPTTAWMKKEHALTWADDVVVVGERHDMALLYDLDRQRARAAGGMLEAAHDGLESPTRVALDLLGYLEVRLGLDEARPTPETRAKLAMEAEDKGALESALEQRFYPGFARDEARAYRKLGALWLEAGNEERALQAFVKAVARDLEAASPRARARAEEASIRAAAQAAADVGALHWLPTLKARLGG